MAIKGLPRCVVDEKAAQQAAATKQKNKGLLLIPDLEGSTEIYEEAKRIGYVVIKTTARTPMGSLDGKNKDCDFLMTANGNALFNPDNGKYEFKHAVDDTALGETLAGINISNQWIAKIIPWDHRPIQISNPEELMQAIGQNRGNIAKFCIEGDIQDEGLEDMIVKLDSHIANSKAIHGWATTHGNDAGTRLRYDISGENDKYTGLIEFLTRHPEYAKQPILSYSRTHANSEPLEQINTERKGIHATIPDSEMDPASQIIADLRLRSSEIEK